MAGFVAPRRAAARLMCLVLVVLAAANGRAQKSGVTPSPSERYGDVGRETFTVPVASNEGVWEGTWFYVSRDHRIAIWIKTELGMPQVKLRYASMNSAEGFETDWNGSCDYKLREASGSFSLGITRRDADVIEGRWSWLLTAGNGARLEEGDYRMYRTGDGRFMALVFDDLVRTVRGGRKNKNYRSPVSYTFRKASKRLALWDELPF